MPGRVIAAVVDAAAGIAVATICVEEVSQQEEAMPPEGASVAAVAVAVGLGRGHAASPAMRPAEPGTKQH